MVSQGVPRCQNWWLAEVYSQGRLSAPACPQTLCNVDDVGFSGYIGDLQTRETTEDLVDKVLGMAKTDPWLLARLYALNDGSPESRQNAPSMGLFQAALTDTQLSGEHRSWVPCVFKHVCARLRCLAWIGGVDMPYMLSEHKSQLCI